jgi:hypothetical protein
MWRQESFERATGLETAGVWEQWLGGRDLRYVRESLVDAVAWRGFITGDAEAMATAPPVRHPYATGGAQVVVPRSAHVSGSEGDASDVGAAGARAPSRRRSTKVSLGSGKRSSDAAVADEEAAEELAEAEAETAVAAAATAEANKKMFDAQVARLASLAPLRLKVRALLFDPSLCGGAGGVDRLDPGGWGAGMRGNSDGGWGASDAHFLHCSQAVPIACTLGASSSLAWPLVPSLFAHRVSGQRGGHIECARVH